ncbi:unnamed protein product [Boreogadus saida]
MNDWNRRLLVGRRAPLDLGTRKGDFDVITTADEARSRVSGPRGRDKPNKRAGYLCCKVRACEREIPAQYWQTHFSYSRARSVEGDRETRVREETDQEEEHQTHPNYESRREREDPRRQRGGGGE